MIKFDQQVPVNEQYFCYRVLLENYFPCLIDCIVSKLSTAQRIPSFFFECFLVLILQCTGILRWKTYTRQTRNANVMSPWNVTFPKNRTDTVLRVLYTTSMGVVAYNDGWRHFTLSFLFNGSECSNPAPIRGGVVSVQSGGFSYREHKSVPAAISGVCNQLRSGDVTITSNLVEGDVQQGHYHGYHPSSPYITSSLHVEELCPSL